MARIFLSHSSENNAEAIALRDWLISHGWDDLFLDLDPERGLKAGGRWQEALKQAAERCELVIFLVSPEWAASKWCLAEFLLAKNLNKRVFGVIVEPTPFAEMPIEMTAEWQLVDLTAGKRDHKVKVRPPPGEKAITVAFAEDGLERLRIGLMQAGLDARYFAWPPEDDPERAPYRGLEPLEAEDAGIFFGRDGPTIVGLDRLRGLREAAPPRLLVILGASGAGKSSFLRAGLLPRLARESQHFLPLPVIRPERAVLTGETGLIASLETALKEAGVPRARADLRKAVEAGPAKVASLLQDLNKARTATHSGDGSKPRQPSTLVLAIDQAEELFHAEGTEEANVFLDLLGTVAVDDDPALIVVFTIRSDNYEQLQTAKSLEGLRQDTFSLPPMPKGAYAEVIKGPARRLEGTKRALKIEEALFDALLADIEDGGAKDALPLLAFTLERLYREEGGDGDLKLTEYEELGRVKGSIEAAVERALKTADSNPKIPRDREARLALLRRGLIPWLAGIDPDTGSPRRRIARRSEIPPESAPLIDLLVEQRLLATDVYNDTGEVTIEPVHEALLRQWGLLQGWLADDHGALATLESVKRAARDWAANAYAPDWLNHAGTRLEEAEQAAGRRDLAGDLSPDARKYLVKCREQEEARRRERLARLEAEREEQERRIKDAEALAIANKRTAQRTGIGLLAALVLVALAGWQWWEAGTARDRAEAETARAELAAKEANAQRERAEAQTARADSKNRELDAANLELKAANLRLSSGFKLKIAPSDRPLFARDTWYAVASDAKLSMAVVTVGSAKLSGFIVKASSLNPSWGSEPLLVTVLGHLCEEENCIEDAYATFPGVDKNKKVALGRILFASDDVVIVRLSGELPSDAIPIVHLRTSFIGGIDPGPPSTPELIEQLVAAVPDLSKLPDRRLEEIIRERRGNDPRVLGPLIMVAWDVDGFFIGFTRLLSKASYPKLIFASVGEYGQTGAPIFDANTGEVVCVSYASDVSLGFEASNCVSLASVIDAVSSVPWPGQ